MLSAVLFFTTGCGSTSALLSFSSYDTNYSQLAQNLFFDTEEFESLPELLTNQICYVEDAPLSNVSPSADIMTAGSILLINTSKKIPVYVKEPYKKVYPASTTKLMTALLTMKKGNLEDIITVKEDYGGVTEYKAQICGFKQGDKVSVETLLNCLLVYSGNDAANLLAEYISGSMEAFVEEMNREAKRLGVKDTTFVNAHGLHKDEHKTTAYDMYLILNACMDYEVFTKISTQAHYTAMYETGEGIVKYLEFDATDQFLSGQYSVPEGIKILGGKTGNTGWAGDCLILSFIGKNRESYIAAVFFASGKDSLYQQITYLMNLT